MKLLRMRFEGVGSFADAMEIDFDKLAGAGLYLIEGPTGSGKSTILDALVYALYGSVAGQQSHLGRLDSQMRTGSPSVTLDFEVAGVPYQVHRVPGHERVKVRGEGFTPENPKASLMRMDTNEELATGVRDVTAHVEQIIGLSKQQFVSTVVLAQGEFANFLDAGTEARAAILERVFGTELYARIESQLSEMRRRANQQITEAQTAVSEAKYECLGALDIELEDEGDGLSAIDALITALQEDLAAARQRADTAQERHTQALQAQQAAKERADGQDRKRAHLQRQQELAQDGDRIDAVRKKLQDHARARQVQHLVDDHGSAEKALQDCRAVQQQALQDLRSLGETREPTAELVTETSDLLGQLRHPLALELGLEEQRVRLGQLQKQVEQANAAVQEAQTELSGIDERAGQLQQTLQSGTDLRDQILDKRLAVSEAQDQQKLAADLAARVAQLEDAQAAVALARKERESAQQAYEQLEQAARADQAAVLAATLVDGQPCIVCGSADHPHPAVGSSGVDAEDLADAREQAALRAADLQEAQLTAGTHAAAVEELRTRVTAGQVADLEQLEQELADLQRRQKERDAARKQLDALQEDRRQASAREGAAKVSAQKATGELDAATGTLKQAEGVVAQARGDAASVGERAASLEKLSAALRAAVDTAAALAEQTRAEQKAREVLDKALTAAGFDSAAQVQAAILDEGAAEQLHEEVQAWEGETAAVAAALQELESVDLSEAVDLDAMTAALSDAGDVLKQAQGEVTRLGQRLDGATPRRDALRERVKQRDEVSERMQPVIRMADYATANKQEVAHRVRLSSFVLMRRFEDVVSAANDRLDNISEGRYQLVVETAGLDKRGQAGLDLRIHDTRSERERDVRSLSGGERFYASLALALGLADVVRGEAGGVELGTLFIDEGFGSLDREILEEVMDMLEQVRTGEDRVIGLISHVELLKERIDARISVRRDPNRAGVSTLTVDV